eukprot:6920204-Prymnesium_polylepis.2
MHRTGFRPARPPCLSSMLASVLPHPPRSCKRRMRGPAGRSSGERGENATRAAAANGPPRPATPRDRVSPVGSSVWFIGFDECQGSAVWVRHWQDLSEPRLNGAGDHKTR